MALQAFRFRQRDDRRAGAATRASASARSTHADEIRALSPPRNRRRAVGRQHVIRAGRVSRRAACAE